MHNPKSQMFADHERGSRNMLMRAFVARRMRRAARDIRQ